MSENGFQFAFQGASLVARASGALWWPARRLLAVGDLHFGKAQRHARARAGGLLPPYEMRETLCRLDAEIEALDPAHVVALGDSFDDPQAEARMLEEDALWLDRLMAGRDWSWITGNHDPGPLSLGGGLRAALTEAGITFRHIAEGPAEVSAHYHPKARLAGVSAPCFLIDADRVILPAFGSYTGGMECWRPPLVDLMGKGALAVLTGRRARALPMPRRKA